MGLTFQYFLNQLHPQVEIYHHYVDHAPRAAQSTVEPKFDVFYYIPDQI